MKKRDGRRIYGLLAGMLFVCSLFITCNKADSDQTSKTYLNLSADAHYVGKEACKTCHADKYESFVHSQMGRSMRPATAKNSDAKWDNVAPIYDANKNFYYLPVKKGEELYVREFRMAGNDTTYIREEKIDLIVGSGQHTNSHMINVNGYIYQAPITWYSQDGKWDLPPGFEDGENSRFDRTIEMECMTCHNAMPEFVEGSANKFVSVPHGIDCERCHGPGSIHVEKKQAGEVIDVTNEIDYSIVNPGKLSNELQFDVCQRCHLQGTAVPLEGKSFADFRPGMKLSDVMNVFLPRYEDSLSNFIMASHPDRLRMSSCYTQSNGELTCINCHDPHRPIETFSAEHYNLACNNCHGGEDQTPCAEGHQFTNNPEDNCVHCHMSISGSEDIPHVRITDHYIRKHIYKGSRTSGPRKFINLVCRTNENASAELMAEGYLSYFERYSSDPTFLDSAKAFLDRASDNSNTRAAKVRYHFLRGDYGKVLDAASKLSGAADAWTNYRIGEAHYQQGDAKGAVTFYQAAALANKENLKFQNKHAVARIAIGQQDQGIEILNSVIQKNPKFASALNNRGYGYVLNGRMKKAEADFLAALALDPDYELAMANLASLYINTGRANKSGDLVTRLLKIDPTNEGYQRLKSMVK